MRTGGCRCAAELQESCALWLIWTVKARQMGHPALRAHSRNITRAFLDETLTYLITHSS